MSGLDPIHIASQWRVRREAGLSDRESGEFARWLSEPGHQEAYRRVERGWSAFDLADSLSVERLKRETRARLRRRRQTAMIARIAAVLVLMAGGGAGWLAVRGDIYDNAGPAPMVVALDDGSRLTLDAESRVAVRYAGDRRRFDLQRGQASFEVAHDPGRPFEVEVGAARVTALGTSFNINRWGGGATVVLLEGGVRVTAGGQTSGAVLTPGQQVTVRDEGLSDVSQAQLTAVGAWRSGLLVFNDQSLEQALASVNRFGQREIELSDPRLGQLRISGLFRTGDTGAFVQGVTELHGLEAAIEPKRIVLQRRR